MMDRAGELVTRGLYEEAIALYRSLGGYSYASSMEKPVTYIQAEELRQAGEYEEAEVLFTALGSYDDSAVKVQQCRADALYDAGDTEGAAAIYDTLEEKYRTHADAYSAESAEKLAELAGGLGWDEYLMNRYPEGSLVTFGRFEQDNNTENGGEPVRWRIVKRVDRKALLVSEYGLYPVRFAAKACTWEESEVCAWLNDWFLNRALTQEECALVIPAEPETGAYASEADRVFLPAELTAPHPATAWAKACGASVNAEGLGICWLRGDADTDGQAPALDADGTLTVVSASRMDVLAVPALWVDLTDATELILPVR